MLEHESETLPRVARLLVLVILLVFLPVAWNGFVLLDNPDYVVHNLVVTRGLSPSGIRWAFTSATWAGDWHPLT